MENRTNSASEKQLFFYFVYITIEIQFLCSSIIRLFRVLSAMLLASLDLVVVGVVVDLNQLVGSALYHCEILQNIVVVYFVSIFLKEYKKDQTCVDQITEYSRYFLGLPCLLILFQFHSRSHFVAYRSQSFRT